MGSNHEAGSSALELILNSTSPDNITPFCANGNLYVTITAGHFKGTHLIGAVRYMRQVSPQTLEPFQISPRSYADGKFPIEHTYNARLFYEDGRFYLEYPHTFSGRSIFRLDPEENVANVDPLTLQPSPN